MMLVREAMAHDRLLVHDVSPAATFVNACRNSTVIIAVNCYIIVYMYNNMDTVTVTEKCAPESEKD